VKHLDSGHAQFVRIVCFEADAAAELASLSRGDGLTITGRLDAEIYAPEGQKPRVSFSVVADRITPLRKTPRDKGESISRKDENHGFLRSY
jgi:single-stranded DNA-binding protein